MPETIVFQTQPEDEALCNSTQQQFQVITIFSLKELHLRYCIGLELNIVTYMKILKGIRGHLP